MKWPFVSRSVYEIECRHSCYLLKRTEDAESLALNQQNHAFKSFKKELNSVLKENEKLKTEAVQHESNFIQLCWYKHLVSIFQEIIKSEKYEVSNIKLPPNCS
jgi:CRISPR/Cas system CMR-associated protein Cmr1 (group 7 of RAMP superfamily)